MKILVFIGPSGSGKSTLMRELHRRGVVESIPSWTTRPRRANQADHAIDHRFVTEAEFKDLQDGGYFLEVVEMFGFRYGLPAISPPPNDKIPAISVRANLLGLVSLHFPDHVVYQIESSLQTVRERIRVRHTPRSETEDRLSIYADELALGRQFCHRLFDTSIPLAEVVGAVERALAEDFRITKADVSSIGMITDDGRSR